MSFAPAPRPSCGVDKDGMELNDCLRIFSDPPVR